MDSFIEKFISVLGEESISPLISVDTAKNPISQDQRCLILKLCASFLFTNNIIDEEEYRTFIYKIEKEPDGNLCDDNSLCFDDIFSFHLMNEIHNVSSMNISDLENKYPYFFKTLKKIYGDKYNTVFSELET